MIGESEDEMEVDKKKKKGVFVTTRLESKAILAWVYSCRIV